MSLKASVPEEGCTVLLLELRELTEII